MLSYVVTMQTGQTHAPPESLIVREALTKMAGELGRVRLALIVAPGGSGKTTLLRCWRDALVANGSTTAWLSLAALHDDAATLIEDLVDSLRAAISVPEFGEELLSELSHVDPIDAPILARRVARSLREIDRPIFLFIDNFHLLETPGTSERLLDLLLRDENIPIHFAISSRGARPGCTARLLTEGQAFEIKAGDLSLRSDQIAHVLRGRGVDSKTVLPLLLAETGGWATGVQLAARGLQHLPADDRVSFIRALGTHDDLFEYVANEVLAEEAPELIELLERAALTGPLPEATLDSITSDFANAGCVDEAIAKGLLIQEGDRIGVHHLWEDLLKRRLRRRITPDELCELNLRLGERLRVEDPRRTLVLWSNAEFWDGVVEVLEEQGHGWIYSGRIHFVADWLAKLPAGRVENAPRLAHLAALTRHRRDASDAIASLEETSERLRRMGEHRQASAALLDAVVIAQNENVREAMTRLLPRLLSFRRLATDPDARALGLTALALLAISHDRHALAQRILRRVRNAGHSQVQRSTVVFGLMLIGRYRDTAATLELLDEVVDDPAYRDHAPSHWMYIAVRALLRGMQGSDRQQCMQSVRDAAEAFQDFGLSMSQMMCRDSLGRLLALEGRREEALEAFERAAELARRIDDLGFEALMFGRVALELLALGRQEEARVASRRAVTLLGEQSHDMPERMAFRFVELVVWRALAECGAATEALAAARSHARTYRSPDLPLASCQTSLQMARIAELTGDQDERRRQLERANGILERHGRNAFGSELDPEMLLWAKANLPSTETEASPRWEVRTLGGLEVLRDGKRIPDRAWRGTTTRRVLVRLLAARGRERREVIQLDLWPDSEPKRAAANLRVALSRLRSALGPEALQSEGDFVMLAPTLLAGWDVTRLSECDALAAVELYRGGFAPELYDDWAEDFRRETEARFLARIRGECEALLESNPQTASEVATRLSEIAPYSEAGWILRVRAELACGDSPSARNTLARARTVLERELGAESGQGLRALEGELDEA